MSFVFVILHYKGFKDTFECVMSIIDNIHYKNFKIVIVDNYSDNGSLEKLQITFDKIENLIILKNSTNLGFAKGNNVGYKYAKEVLNADFIILLNNDTIIEQKEFLTKIIDIYDRTKFNILGPDILSVKDGKHQNPQRLKGADYVEVKRNVNVLKVLYTLSYINLDIKFVNFKNYLLKIFKMSNISNYNDNSNFNKELHNVQLHGACLIFDKFYIKNFNGLYSKTFMYAEEDILYYIANKESLKIVYNHDIQIFHKEGSSTDIIAKSSRNKRMFNYKNSLNSFKQLKKMYTNKNIYTKDLL